MEQQIEYLENQYNLLNSKYEQLIINYDKTLMLFYLSLPENERYLILNSFLDLCNNNTVNPYVSLYLEKKISKKYIFYAILIQVKVYTINFPINAQSSLMNIFNEFQKDNYSLLDLKKIFPKIKEILEDIIRYQNENLLSNFQSSFWSLVSILNKS